MTMVFSTEASFDLSYTVYKEIKVYLQNISILRKFYHCTSFVATCCQLWVDALGMIKWQP